MRCNVCSFAGLLTVLLVVTNVFRLGYAMTSSATLKLSFGAPPPTRNHRRGAPSVSSSAELPSANLVIKPRASGILHLQPAVAPQVLNSQLLESMFGASPRRSRHPTRSRMRRPVAAPSSRIRGRHRARHGAPATAPALASVPVFAPMPSIVSAPPSNYTQDCRECEDGYTSSPAGTPCGCVIPMTTSLQLAISLEKLFPLVAELAKELAESLYLQPSQVRIMGANAVAQFQDKTDVTAQFVPLATAFDNTTAVLLASQIWDRRLKLNETLFGHYLVILVHYPGLPPSPPSQTDSDPSIPPSISNGESVQRPTGVAGVKLSSAKLAVIALASTIGAVITLCVIWLILLKCNSRVRSLENTLEVNCPSALKRFSRSGGVSRVSESFQSAASFHSREPSILGFTGTAKCFFLAELIRATDNFNSASIVGQGGFGTVYQGKLDDGTPVAVKVLTRGNQQGDREFVAEVEMLSRLHHRNLVKLVGICTEDIQCLVYELIPNGSVESHLHGIDKSIAPLDWEARLKIALGSARGLAYLHEDSNPRVIHRDFKSSNILLEMDYTPKVSDFGLAKAAAEGGHSQHVFTRVMGTFGYVAPEYAMTGHLLVKSDVYSYGVVLLELLSGRMPVDMGNPEGQHNLVTWARPLLTTREGLETLIDSNLPGDLPLDDFAKVAAIASMCVQPEVSHRPCMGEVVQALKLVYKDLDVCESHPGNYSPEPTKFGACSDPRARFLPDSSFLSSDYDSGPLYSRDLDAARPMSASAVLSDSGHPTRQLSGSFRCQSNSGPLKTSTGHKPPAWYRLRTSKAVTTSEHGVANESNHVYHGSRESKTRRP